MSTHSPKRQKISSTSPSYKAMEVDDSMASSTTPSSSAAGGAAAAAHDFDDDEALFPGAGTATAATATATTNAADADAADADAVAVNVDAQTPQNDHLNAAAPGELSPPRSQAQDGTVARPAANGEHAADELNKDGGGSSGGGGGEDVPGAGWKNKKAQEEKHRALEWLVDRDFSLEPFGDVVLLGKQQRSEE